MISSFGGKLFNCSTELLYHYIAFECESLSAFLNLLSILCCIDARGISVAFFSTQEFFNIFQLLQAVKFNTVIGFIKLKFHFFVIYKLS